MSGGRSERAYESAAPVRGLQRLEPQRPVPGVRAITL